MPRMNLDYPIIVLGNGGYKKLYVENTLLSFKKAVEVGADGVNLCVWVSKESSIVVNHDKFVEDNEGRIIEIKELDYKTIKKIKLPMKQHIPTLEMVINELPEDTLINVKVNEFEAIENTLRIIKSFSAIERILISSENKDILKKFREKEKDLFLGYYLNKKEDVENIFLLNSEIGLYSANIPMEGILFYGLENYKNFASRVKEENMKIFIKGLNDTNYITILKGYYDVIVTEYIEDVISQLQKTF
jgi:glycerophosphoryl diester phosphodiesterase